MNPSDSIVELRTTFGSRETAEACASRLVAARLAACVQIDGPVSSTFSWRAAVDHVEEFRCTCKTTPERAEACVEAILRDHDYETPELLRSLSTATPAYAAWVRSSVAEG